MPASCLPTSEEGKALRGLEIAGEVGPFAEVTDDKVTIDGNKIIIDDSAARVRYGWKPYTTANMINEEGLPASTFEIKVTNK